MAYKIPLFNLNFDEKEARAAYDTIKSGWISTGPKNAELEQMSTLYDGRVLCFADKPVVVFIHYNKVCRSIVDKNVGSSGNILDE